MSFTNTPEDLAPLEAVIRRASDSSEVEIDAEFHGLPSGIRDQLPRRTLDAYERSLFQVRQQIARQRTLELAERVIELFLSVGGVRLKIDRERPFVLRKKRGGRTKAMSQQADSANPRVDSAGAEAGQHDAEGRP